MIRFEEGTSPEAAQALAEGLRTLPGQIAEIRGYQVGPDLGVSDGSWDFAVSADFDSVDDFNAYRAHPAHVQVVRELLEPISAERHSVQFEV
jgi:hypothetical protein